MGLYSLWSISLGLSGVSLTIMAGLILARLVSERQRRSLAEQHRKLLPVLLDPSSADAALEEMPVPRRFLADLSVELIRLVRGEDREQFVAAAARAGVADEHRRRLARGSARTRALSAEALRFFPDARSTDALETALEDRSADVRLAAAIALAESGRSPPAAVLIDRLGIGQTEQSLLVVNLFQHLADDRPHEVRKLIDEPGTSPKVKAAAIEALATTGDYRLVPLINELALATDPTSEDLPRYLRALGAFHHPAGAAAVRKSLASPSWWVRAAAAEAAGRIVLTDTAPTLFALLGDEDWWVRFRSGEALAKLGAEGRSLLVEAARTASEPARSAARFTLAEQGLPA